MLPSPCPYCGYDLSGLGEAGEVRTCPECGQSSRLANIAPPWWLARPARLLGALLLGGLGASVVSFGALMMDGPSLWAWTIPFAAVALGAIGWSWFRVAEFRGRHGSNMLPWSTFVHLAIMVVVALPIGFLFGWAVIGGLYLVARAAGQGW
jgi:hypothetical protein